GAGQRAPVLVPGVRGGRSPARTGSHGAPAEGEADARDGRPRWRTGRRSGRRHRHERSADPGPHPEAAAAGAGGWRSPGAGAATRRTEVTRSGAARVAVLLTGAAVAVGCATLETSKDHVNPDNPLWYQRPSGAIHVLFRRELTATPRTVGEPYERGRGEIDPEHGRMFLGTSDHGMYALRASNGRTLWRFETLGSVQCEALYDAELDVVYFGSNDGALYAVHAADGALVWRYDSGGEVTRKPVLGGEVLYFANGADNLFAVDRRTGKPLWHVHRTSALGMEVSGYAGPALDQGMVFFAFSDGHVGAYDARDGSERWTPVDLSAEAEQLQGGEAR